MDLDTLNSCSDQIFYSSQVLKKQIRKCTRSIRIPACLLEFVICEWHHSCLWLGWPLCGRLSGTYPYSCKTDTVESHTWCVRAYCVLSVACGCTWGAVDVLAAGLGSEVRLWALTQNKVFSTPNPNISRVHLACDVSATQEISGWVWLTKENVSFYFLRWSFVFWKIEIICY
jgi:hypothetical protein